MVQRSKQDWTIGKEVKVGFLTLTITGIRAVKDFMPDIYDLVSAKGIRYEFIPHNGLVRIDEPKGEWR